MGNFKTLLNIISSYEVFRGLNQYLVKRYIRAPKNDELQFP